MSDRTEGGGGADSNEPKVWYPQQEGILKKWAEVSSSYRFIHNQSHFEWRKWSVAFSLPVIALSTLTGTANFAHASFPEEWKNTVPLLIGGVNIVTGIISTISRFLRVDELTEAHQAASVGFGKLSRSITMELSLPVDERSTGGREFLTYCRAELDRLLEQSPVIPPKVAAAFNTRFKDRQFTKPEIVDILPVEVFTPSKADLDAAKAKAAKALQSPFSRAVEQVQVALKTMDEIPEDGGVGGTDGGVGSVGSVGGVGAAASNGVMGYGDVGFGNLNGVGGLGTVPPPSDFDDVPPL